MERYVPFLCKILMLKRFMRPLVPSLLLEEVRLGLSLGLCLFMLRISRVSSFMQWLFWYWRKQRRERVVERVGIHI